MSHATGWRAACITTNHILGSHFDTPSIARGVTDGGVGSGALFGERRLETTSEQKDEYSELTTGNCCSWSRKQGSKTLGDGRDADE